MVYEHKNYKSFLKSVYAERVAKNPSYSLRAFSSQIGITQSMLVRIFKDQKNISFERSVVIAEKLQLEKSEAEYFTLLVQFETAKKQELKHYIQERLNLIAPQNKSYDLSVDVFKAIAEWYHVPILQLVTLPGFEASTKNIAKRLGITSIEAQVAVERLLRLELLEQTAPAQYRQTHDRILVNSKIPSSALQSFHRQLLEKAIEALTTQTPHEKVNGSETFVYDPSTIEEARQVTKEYYNKMNALSEKSKNPTEVYHLAVNFFRITKQEKLK